MQHVSVARGSGRLEGLSRWIVAQANGFVYLSLSRFHFHVAAAPRKLATWVAIKRPVSLSPKAPSHNRQSSSRGDLTGEALVEASLEI